MSQMISSTAFGSKTSDEKEKAPSLICPKSRRSSTNVYINVRHVNINLRYRLAKSRSKVPFSDIISFSMAVTKKRTEPRGVFISWLTVEEKLSAYWSILCFSWTFMSYNLEVIFFVASLIKMTMAASPSYVCLLTLILTNLLQVWRFEKLSPVILFSDWRRRSPDFNCYSSSFLTL